MNLLRMLTFTLAATLYLLSHTTEGVVVYACHNDTAVMSCEVGSKMKLHHILYKVGVGTRCGEGKHHPDDGPDTFCSFPWADMVVEDLCGNRRTCEVPVTEVVFGEYPCKETTRYLEVSYTCVVLPSSPPAPAKADCDIKEEMSV
ncbi:protein eva-1-like [Entelurus aequoreus]|uniref:protein eva-1-like n=1 Tax=Entelurus aequoreus TaxID=161455 RepID=UPI002B1DFDC2|nr:protein eva-1-like [Entelurus aequoreus]XP_061880135.1 protein eva-1-like [Entelurus aequoreus]